MKNIILSSLFAFNLFYAQAQTKDNFPKEFIQNLTNHCGKAYAGKITSNPIPTDFNEKELIMYVSSCNDKEVKISFFVGDDLSRTWIYTLKGDRIELKHDHRQPNGQPDEITMYGGTSSNTGNPNAQYFPADQETSSNIPAAAANIWWVTINNDIYTYNLQRLGSKNSFTVEFDITNPINTNKRAW